MRQTNVKIEAKKGDYVGIRKLKLLYPDADSIEKVTRDKFTVKQDGGQWNY